MSLTTKTTVTEICEAIAGGSMGPELAHEMRETMARVEERQAARAPIRCRCGSPLTLRTAHSTGGVVIAVHCNNHPLDKETEHRLVELLGIAAQRVLDGEGSQ